MFFSSAYSTSLPARSFPSAILRLKTNLSTVCFRTFYSFTHHLESRGEHQEAVQVALKAANYETAGKRTSASIGTGIGSGGGSAGAGQVGDWKDIQSTISGPYFRWMMILMF